MSGSLLAGRSGWARVLVVVAAGALIAGLVVLRHQTVATPVPTPTPTEPPPSTTLLSPTPSSASETDQEPSSSTGPGTSAIVQGLSGAQFDIVGYGPKGVLRLNSHTGSVTLTPVPLTETTTPVDLLVGPDRILVHPGNDEASYIVFDGYTVAGPAAPVLAASGPIVPGPDDMLWRPIESHGVTEMWLVDWVGTPRGISIAMPADAKGVPEPDGRGFLLFRTAQGVVDATPSGTHRLTAGTVLAVGAGYYLTLECARPGCKASLVRADGSVVRSFAFSTAGLDTAAETGIISPDGEYAAIPTAAGSVGIVNLTQTGGTIARISVTLPKSYGYRSLAWTDDSSWLFIASADQRIYAVNPRTGLVNALSSTLPPVTQIGIRASGR